MLKSNSEINQISNELNIQKYKLERPKLINLIRNINCLLDFNSQTFFLSLFYMDKIFSNTNLIINTQRDYIILSLSCLLIASKFNENDPHVPELIKYISLCEQFSNFEFIFNIDELRKGEMIILHLLEFKINYYSIYHFLVFFFTHGIIFESTLNRIENGAYSKKKILEKIYILSRGILDYLLEDNDFLDFENSNFNFIFAAEILKFSIETILDINILDEENVFKCIYHIDNNNNIIYGKINEIYEEKILRINLNPSCSDRNNLNSTNHSTVKSDFSNNNQLNNINIINNINNYNNINNNIINQNIDINNNIIDINNNIIDINNNIIDINNPIINNENNDINNLINNEDNMINNIFVNNNINNIKSKSINNLNININHYNNISSPHKLIKNYHLYNDSHSYRGEKIINNLEINQVEQDEKIKGLQNEFIEKLENMKKDIEKLTKDKKIFTINNKNSILKNYSSELDKDFIGKNNMIKYKINNGKAFYYNKELFPKYYNYYFDKLNNYNNKNYKDSNYYKRLLSDKILNKTKKIFTKNKTIEINNNENYKLGKNNNSLYQNLLKFKPSLFSNRINLMFNNNNLNRFIDENKDLKGMYSSWSKENIDFILQKDYDSINKNNITNKYNNFGTFYDYGLEHYLKRSNNIYSTKLNLFNSNNNNRYNLLFGNDKYY